MVSSGISGIKCLPNERLRKDFPLAPAPVSAVDEQQRSGIRFAPNEPPCRLNDANHARQGHATGQSRLRPARHNNAASPERVHSAEACRLKSR